MTTVGLAKAASVKPRKAAVKRPSLPPLLPFLEQTKLVPALRDPAHLDKAIAARGKIIYLLCGEPDGIGDMLQRILSAGKLPIVNIDLVAGLSRDGHAIRYLERRGAKGIISTHGDTLNQARALGLYIIQRTFLLDSGAIESIRHQIRHHVVDALEVLPAVAAPKLVPYLEQACSDIALVGGGLVTGFREAEDLLAQGLVAISASSPQLWCQDR